MTDPATQLERFREAVELLGGLRETGRLLDAHERTIRALITGQRTLHDGWLRDIAAALITRAEKMRALERQLSPAFIGNLTDEQELAPRHGNRRDIQATRHGNRRDMRP